MRQSFDSGAAFERELLEAPRVDDHFVQLYETDDTVLVDNVAAYLLEGFRRGDALLVVATRERREALACRLRREGIDLNSTHTERTSVFDAHSTLARLIVDGLPDGDRFDAIVGEAVGALEARSGKRPIRAYGEMVGILWDARQYPAAIRLEQLWNRLRKSKSFALFCSYPLDIFSDIFEPGVVDALLCAHTHLLPGPRSQLVGKALGRAMEEVLGTDAARYQPWLREKLRTDWAQLPSPEATILGLRRYFPAKAKTILERAREYYAAAT